MGGRFHLIQSLLGVALAVGAAWTSGCNREGQQGEASSTTNDSLETVTLAKGDGDLVVDVDVFMRSSDLQKQAVTVEGVVSAVSPNKKMVALIDLGEAVQCRTVSCAALTLPVRWEGQPPRIGQQVRVTGSVRQSPEGKVFIAREVIPGEQVVGQ
jgi:hypothetical protein